jgi:CBS domain-containing protein
MSTSSLRFNGPPEARDDEPVVRHLMTSSVVAITTDSDLLIASRLMAARSVRHLPVMDNRRCCGLLLEIEVIQALAAADHPLIRAPLLVGELCRPAPTVRPEDRRSVAARQMRETGLDAVLVCAGNSVVGIVTATDLVRSLAEEVIDGPRQAE